MALIVVAILVGLYVCILRSTTECMDKQRHVYGEWGGLINSENGLVQLRYCTNCHSAQMQCPQ